MTNKTKNQTALVPFEIGTRGGVSVDLYREHANKLYYEFYAKKQHDQKSSFIPSTITDSEEKFRKDIFVLVSLTLQCCIMNKVDFTAILTISDARKVLREHSGLNELQKFLQDVPSVLNRDRLINASGVKKVVKNLWEYPECRLTVREGGSYFQNMKDEVTDTMYWLQMVKTLLDHGNEKMLDMFMGKTRYNYLKTDAPNEKYFRKDKVFATLIVCTLIEEVKNEFDINDVKAVIRKFKVDIRGVSQIGVTFAKVFSGSHLENMEITKIPTVKRMIKFMASTYIPSYLPGKINLEQVAEKKLRALNQAYNTCTELLSEKKDGLNKDLNQKLIRDLNGMISRESCTIFPKIYLLDAKLLLYLDANQRRRLVFTNKLHNFIDTDDLRNVFVRAGKGNEFQEDLDFATKSMDPTEFVKLLTLEANQLILKDIRNYQTDLVFIKKRKEIGLDVTQVRPTGDTMVLLNKMIRLLGSKMTISEYCSFLLSLTVEQNIEPDDSMKLLLFLRNKNKKLPKYVTDYAEKQIWYDIFDESLRRKY